jgi:hypothetical protein
MLADGKFDAARDAVRALLWRLRDGVDSISLVVFSDTARVHSRLSDGPLTPERRVWLLARLLALECGMGTDIGHALETAYASAKDAKHATFLLLSDGAPVSGRTRGCDLAPPSDSEIFTFGIGTAPNDVLLTDIANEGGGLYFNLEKGSIAETMATAVARIASVLARDTHLVLDTFHQCSLLTRDSEALHLGSLRAGDVRNVLLALSFAPNDTPDLLSHSFMRAQLIGGATNAVLAAATLDLAVLPDTWAQAWAPEAAVARQKARAAVERAVRYLVADHGVPLENQLTVERAEAELDATPLRNDPVVRGYGQWLRASDSRMTKDRARVHRELLGVARPSVHATDALPFTQLEMESTSGGRKRAHADAFPSSSSSSPNDMEPVRAAPASPVFHI